MEENKDEPTAIELIYRKQYHQRHLSYEQIEEFAESIKAPPYNPPLYKYGKPMSSL